MQQDNCICCGCCLYSPPLFKNVPLGLDCITINVSDNAISQWILKVLYYIKLSDWTKATVRMSMTDFKQNIFFPI